MSLYLSIFILKAGLWLDRPCLKVGQIILRHCKEVISYVCACMHELWDIRKSKHFPCTVPMAIRVWSGDGFTHCTPRHLDGRVSLDTIGFMPWSRQIVLSAGRPYWTFFYYSKDSIDNLAIDKTSVHILLLILIDHLLMWNLCWACKLPGWG